MFEIQGSRKGYYQWDLNQKLYIQDSSCNEVHFCSEKHPEALTCLVRLESGKRYVQVPNILLQSCLPVTAFAYVKGEADAYTKRSVAIEVWERPKPDDYVYTETEVKTWESAVEYALQEAKESGAFRGDKGEKGDKGDIGERGPRGEKGEKGDGVLTREEKLEFFICCCEEGERINLKDAAKQPLAGMQIFGKTTQNGTPTPDAPVDLVSVGDGGTIKTYVRGKNLFDASKGLEYGAWQPLFVPAGTYITLSVFPTDGTANLNYKIRYADGTETGAAALVDNTSANNVWHTVNINASKATDSIQIYHSNLVNNTQRTVGKAMVRIGSFSTTVDADYEEFNGQDLTISTPNGLPGIPVTSGGNYTDSDGQRWLCDEIDFARGVYVRRIGQHTFTGEETVSKYGNVNEKGFGRWQIGINTGTSSFVDQAHAVASLSNKYTASAGNVLAGLINNGGVGYHFAFVGAEKIAFSTDITDLVTFTAEIAGTTLLYQLATPIETPISEEELTDYAALYTHKPNTIIYNDAGAWMQVDYAADSKTYIDNKFAELAAAIVNNT